MKDKDKFVTVYVLKVYWSTRSTYPVILNLGNRSARWSTYVPAV